MATKTSSFVCGTIDTFYINYLNNKQKENNKKIWNNSEKENKSKKGEKERETDRKPKLEGAWLEKVSSHVLYLQVALPIIFIYNYQITLSMFPADHYTSALSCPDVCVFINNILPTQIHIYAAR